MVDKYGRALAVILTGLALSAAAPDAQSARATDVWFGVALPTATQDPHKAVVDVAQAVPPAVRLPGATWRTPT
jgi:hypothetical protein